MLIASYGVALNPNDQRADRVTGGLRYNNDEFDPVSGNVVPDERDFRYLFVRYEHADNDFLKLNFVNKDLRYEDFNLGRQFSIEAATSPRAFGAPANTAFGRVFLGDGIHLDESSFIMPAIAFESRFDHGPQNAILTGVATYVHRYDTDHPAASVARIYFANGWRMDRDLQFFADGVTGLRAYRLHSFEGTRAFIANYEHRIYLGHEIAQLVSPGVVGFIDSGNATTNGNLFDLKTDVGVGIRIGLPRTPKNLLRLDFAYAINRDPRGRRGFLISFSSGQAF